MPFISQNPATEETLAEYPEFTDSMLDAALERSSAAQKAWATVSFEDRAKPMKKLATLFREKKDEIGKLISLEMGRTIATSPAEAEKCAWACDYYADEARQMLAPINFPEGAGEGEIRHAPLGVVLAVMPWNYPFWQVIRFAAPTLMAGNAGLLKHAANVPQSAAYLEKLFKDAGFPDGLFQNLFITIPQVGKAIDDDRVAAVTLTGSVRAGSSVAERAGKNIKKAVLELGGSDPFIVLGDADVEAAVKDGVTARLQNNGQSCIAAKRFLVEEKVYEAFMSSLTRAFESQVVGDQMDPKTTIGPLAMKKFADEIERQVNESVEKGAKVVVGGKRTGERGAYYAPTILEDVREGSPAHDEEIFGPVATVFMVKSDEEAVGIANATEFGLGSSVWTRDMARADTIANALQTGNVFINKMVKSDPRVPFGGIKKSGYGRELGRHGILEFVNAKTISVERPKGNTPADDVE